MGLFEGWDKPIPLEGIEDKNALEAGEYAFTVNDVEMVTATDGSSKLLVKLRDSAGKSGVDSITGGTLWKFKQLCVAAGFAPDAQVFYPSLKGKRIKATVTQRDYQGVTYNNYKYHK